MSFVYEFEDAFSELFVICHEVIIALSVAFVKLICYKKSSKNKVSADIEEAQSQEIPQNRVVGGSYLGIAPRQNPVTAYSRGGIFMFDTASYRILHDLSIMG